MKIDEDFVLKVGEEGKAEQFPLDEIRDETKRMVRGYASVEIKDSQGEIMPIKDLKRSMNIWMDRGGIITDSHSNRVVGKGLNWKEVEHPKTKKPAILMDYKIHKDYSIDDQVWDEIKSGKRKGLSFGGRALDEPEIKRDKDGDGSVKELSNLEAYEMASVEDPANKLAENIAINYLAKSNSDNNSKLLLEDLKKGYKGDIKKPFGGFDSFSSCISAQKERGHSQDSSERICGFLKNRTEKSWMEGKKKQKQEEEYGPHSHDEENPEGLHSHQEDMKKRYSKKLDDINKKFDKINKILMFKNLEKKLNVISKALEYSKDKKKSLFKIISLPKGKGDIVEVEFPSGQRQILRLKNKSKGKEDKVEEAIGNAVRTFESTSKSKSLNRS